jgi:hypothetical protein
MLFQQSIAPEFADDISNRAPHCVQLKNDVVSFDNLRLSERYLNWELHILLHFILRDSLKYVAWFQIQNRVPALRVDMPSGNGGFKAGSKEPAVNIPGIAWGHAMESVLGANSEQQAVFVDVVKTVEMPQDFIAPTLVRFDLRHRFYGIAPKAMFYSPRVGIKFLAQLADREIDLFNRSRPKLDKVVSKVIESTPDVIDGISRDERNISGNRRNVDDAVNALPGVRIVLGRDWIRAGVDKRIPSTIQLEDVFFGPF